MEKRYCRKCGEELLETSLFCRKCGEKIVLEPETENIIPDWCPKCGGVIKNGVCNKCGFDILNSEKQAEEPEKETADIATEAQTEENEKQENKEGEYQVKYTMYEQKEPPKPRYDPTQAAIAETEKHSTEFKGLKRIIAGIILLAFELIIMFVAKDDAAGMPINIITLAYFSGKHATGIVGIILLISGIKAYKKSK